MTLQRGQTRRDRERVRYYHWGEDGTNDTYETDNLVEQAKWQAGLDGFREKLDNTIDDGK